MSGYTVEVTNLSPKATEGDVYDFFAFSGAIERVEIIRSGEYGSTAYVAFKEPHSLETAVLLSGATIVDQPVCISRWGYYENPSDIWGKSSWTSEEYTQHEVTQGHYSTTAGEAVTFAQDVMKTMVSKGYILGKDALVKARAFDESHQVSATAAAKVADLSRKMGLTDKINSSMAAVRSVDEQYHVSEATKTVVSATGTVVSATGRAAASAATSFVNSSYFAAGAMWVSGALDRASKAAADLATRNS